MSNCYLLHPKLKEEHPVQRCGWPDCGAACCIYGAWVDKIHANDILSHADLIAPQMPPDYRDPSVWFDGQEEPDDHALSGLVVHTTILPNAYHYGGTSCIFLREDHKCALQAAAVENDLHEWRFKPFYCILHPLDINDEGQVTIDDLDLLIKEPTACVKKGRKKISLLELFQREIQYLVGKQDAG